ncbi:hypothetical protein CONPUDRAFT_85705 [Coniophora puteana RWD-64-598 SS2]|uniref:DUF6533 domain-containing protein n=1 Tax=Coniophora puteana (strain RWD-64-598) TaxID=741705 RepID=A0A5M3M6R3_CONPW|nr:uncharacterized protein CONPUDRAFT_85705 [Coniophora puteana RWD-64-598 SS2]EIW75042.1 hypothetical protein CONPUDRAFT_85705 [Coniophora puteana RWD-64-598 SS2]
MEKAYEELVYFADGNKLVNYFEVSITALFLYDYFLNLGDEIQYIWSRRGWGMGKSLYIMARYINFAIIPITLADQLDFPTPEKACAPLFYASTATQAFAITVSQCLFSLRNYAMWNGKRAAMILSIVNLVTSLLIVSVLLATYMPSITFGPSPIPAISGCFKTGGNNQGLSGTFVVIIANEAILLGSILVRLRQQTQSMQSHLLETLMRDGVLYCAVIFILSVINAAVEFSVPIAYIETTEMFQSVLQTVLATNMQLHLCRVHETTSSRGAPSERLSTMQFSDRGGNHTGPAKMNGDNVVIIEPTDGALSTDWSNYDPHTTGIEGCVEMFEMGGMKRS